MHWYLAPLLITVGLVTLALISDTLHESNAAPENNLHKLDPGFHDKIRNIQQGSSLNTRSDTPSDQPRHNVILITVDKENLIHDLRNNYNATNVFNPPNLNNVVIADVPVGYVVSLASNRNVVKIGDGELQLIQYHLGSSFDGHMINYTKDQHDFPDTDISSSSNVKIGVIDRDEYHPHIHLPNGYEADGALKHAHCTYPHNCSTQTSHRDDTNEHANAIIGILIGVNLHNEGWDGLAAGSKVVLAQTYEPRDLHPPQSNLISAFDYLVGEGVHVISISYGPNLDCQENTALPDTLIQPAIGFVVDDIVRSKGTVVVAAAGNSHTNAIAGAACTFNGMSVGAVYHGDSIWYSSSRGGSNSAHRFLPDIVALGANVEMVGRGGNVDMLGRSDNYFVSSGTSFATPVVAAAAARILDESIRQRIGPDPDNPRYNPLQIKSALLLGANWKGGIFLATDPATSSLYDVRDTKSSSLYYKMNEYGFGSLNISRSLSYVNGGETPNMFYEQGQSNGRSYTITVDEGDTVKILLSWFADTSGSDPPFSLQNIVVPTSANVHDYNLEIRHPDGTIVEASESDVQSTEFILFNNAPEGTYTIRVLNNESRPGPPFVVASVHPLTAHGEPGQPRPISDGDHVDYCTDLGVVYEEDLCPPERVQSVPVHSVQHGTQLATPPRPTTSLEILFQDEFNSLAGWEGSGWRSSIFDEDASAGRVAEADNCSSLPNTNACTMTMRTGIDLTGHNNEAVLLFRYLDDQLDSGEFLAMRAIGDSSSRILELWTARNDDSGDDDDEWHVEEISLSRFTNDRNVRLQFLATSNSVFEEVGVDTVTIVGWTDVSVDTTDPILSIPPHIRAEARGLLTPIDIGQAYAVDSQDSSVAITNNDPDWFTVGVTLVTWTATDDAGNSVSDSQWIVIQDTLPPVVRAPPDIVLNATGLLTPVPNLGTARAWDLADSSPSMTNNAPDSLPFGTTVVTWRATDDSGNRGTDTQAVTILERYPYVQLANDTAQTILQGSGPYADPGATCVDDVDADRPINSTAGTVDTNTVGTYHLTYSCADSEGNRAYTATRTVTVEDAPPTITLNGNSAMTAVHRGTFVDPGASCLDLTDGELPVTTRGSVNADRMRSYDLTYQCTDSHRHTASVQRTVTVVPDTDPPALTLFGPGRAVIDQDTRFLPDYTYLYPDPGALCTDDADADRTVYAEPTPTTRVPGNYTLTYTCTDSDGNAAVPVNRTLTVLDIPPSAYTLGRSTIVLTVGANFTDPGARCHDLTEGYLTVSVNGTIDTSTPGTYYLAYGCQDSGGRQAAPAVRTVAVVPPNDGARPVLVLLGPNPDTVDQGSRYYDQGALCIDDEDPDRNVPGPGYDGNTPGTTTLSYACTDSDGNVAVPVNRTLTILDMPPRVYLYGDDSAVLRLDANFTDPGASCYDRTEGYLTVSVNGTIDTSTLGTHHLAYGCQDSGGRQAEPAIRIVRVIASMENIPVVTLNGAPVETILQGLAYADPGAACADDADDTRTVFHAGHINTTAAGTRTLAYGCTDSHGNEADPAYRFLVVRDAPPVITLNGPAEVTVLLNRTYADPGAACADLTDGLLLAIAGGQAVDASAVGSYAPTYSCTDSHGHRVTVARNVTVALTAPANRPPVADAGPDQAARPGTAVTLNGTGSSDPDGDRLAHSWSQVSGEIVALSNATSPTPTFTAPAGPATLVFGLNVTDGSLSSTDTVTVNVTAPTNHPPTVDAGPDRTVNEGSTVRLNGTASDDGPPGELTYLWTSHPADPAIRFEDPADPATTFTAPSVDADTTLTLTLEVSDGNSTGSDSAAVTIRNTAGSDFVTTWRTAAHNETVTIPVGRHSAGAYTVDWGDGTTSANAAGSQIHEYASPGNHTIRISGDFARIHLGGDPVNAAKLVSIDQWGGIRWATMREAFAGATNMAYRAADTPDLSSVTDMSGMFRNAASFNGDVSGWDVSGTTDMSNMFEGAASFNQDISAWNVSDVINMSHMFRNAASFNQDIAGWDVSSATDMSGMFEGAAFFGQNLGDWYVVPDNTTIRYQDAPGTVGQISARNAFLDGRNPTYGIGTGGDSAFFGIANGTTLVMETAPGRPIQNPYIVNVTASGVLGGDGPHHRIIRVNVIPPPNVPPAVSAGPDLAIFEGGTAFLNGTASDPDSEDGLAVRWTQSPSMPALSFENASSTATAFTAPLVSRNATITLTLTATDSRNGTTTDTATIRIVDTPLPPGAFVTTWRTTAPNEPVTIPAGRDTGAYHIDWGDGSVSAGVTDSQTHRYETPGEHTVAIAGDFDRMNMAGNAANAAKLVSIDQWGDIRWTSMRSAFYGAANMVYRATDIPDLSSVDTMAHMFRNAASFNGDISGWDVSAVSSMFSMFDGATSFSQNLGRWYVTLDETAIPHGDPSRTVGTISAQNAYLDGRNPAYGIGTGADSGLFEISDGSLLRLREVPDYYDRSSYAVNVTADGSRLFGEDNHVLLEVTVAAPINNPPTADAGPDRTVRPGTAVTLNGTGSSDPDVLDRLSYSWNQTAGEPVSLSNRTSPTPAFDAPGGASVLAFELSVTDRGGLSDADTVSVNVTSDAPANRPPVVNAGPDLAVNEGEPVALSGTASDPEGDQLAYLWTHDSSLDLDMEGADTVSVSFTAPQVSSNTTITLTLTAADRHNQTAADSATVTILDVPEEPPAQPIRNSTAVLEPPDPRGPRDIGRITLTSSSPGTIHASWEEPAEDPANYRISWARVGEPFKTWTDQTGNAFPTEPAHTITGLEEGVEYKVMVLASYSGTSGGWSGELTIAVAESSPNRPPTVSAGPDLAVNEGQPVALSGTATDPDGDQLTHLWTHDSTLAITLENATALSTTFTAPEVGSNTTVTLTLTATDPHNATAADTMTLTVTDVPAAPANRPPSVDAGPDLNVAEGQPVALSGTATDQDGDQLTYLWTHDSTLAITLENATALSTTFTAPEVGSNTTVTFTLTANDGAATASDSVAVTITDTPAEPPLGPREIGEITLGSTQPGTVRASWNPTIEEARDYRISWARAGEPFPSWTDSSGNAYPTDPSHTITGLDEGEEYKVKVRARYADDTSGPWSGEFTIMVASAANNPPVANAGPDRAVASGAAVELDGFGSNDPDGDTLSYLWSQTSGQSVALSNATAPSPTFTAPAGPAALVFRLNVTDTGSLSSSDTVTVNVAAPANRPPTVDAGDGQSVQEGNTATLTGTASDPDGDPLTYRWTHDSALTITLENATALSTTFTAPGVDSDTAITFTLTAEDGRGASSSDTVSVTILAGSPPDPPQNLQATSTNTTVTLTWDDPGDVTITGYKILSRAPVTQTQLSTLVNNTASAAATYTVTDLEPGTTYVFRVVAINEHGESGRSDFVRISTLP